MLNVGAIKPNSTAKFEINKEAYLVIKNPLPMRDARRLMHIIDQSRAVMLKKSNVKIKNGEIDQDSLNPLELMSVDYETVSSIEESQNELLNLLVVEWDGISFDGETKEPFSIESFKGLIEAMPNLREEIIAFASNQENFTKQPRKK